MGKRNIRKPKKGDLVIVRWVDIAGGESGEPEVPVFETPGFFIGWRGRGEDRILHIARSRIANGTSLDWQTGWDAYPPGAVRSIVVKE